jgi:hypothetical protein
VAINWLPLPVPIFWMSKSALPAFSIDMMTSAFLTLIVRTFSVWGSFGSMTVNCIDLPPVFCLQIR